jgi:hypothetical protein
MYETTDLTDAAYLNSLGHPVQSARPNGELVTLGFSMSPEEAQTLLRRPERDTCARFRRAVRHVRRLIDIARLQQGVLP